MSTATLTHHPVPMAAAAAAVVAIALGGVAFSIANDSTGSVAPSDQHQQTVVQSKHGYHPHQFQPTTSGGKVITEP
jgi:streptogramin lyase